MKQYSPVFRHFPFSSKLTKNEPFFEPQHFTKIPSKGPNDSIHLKWFAPSSNDFFLLAINGLDAQVISEIKGLLKSRIKSNLDDCGANSIQEMLDSVVEFSQTAPTEIDAPASFSATKTSDCAAENNSVFLESLNEKIEENLGNEHFRGTDLAKLLCCCEMQLYRKIKQVSKLSPANYIRRYRLHRSLRSLQGSDLPISQVCFNMGFRSLEYFSRSFKKEFGICPSAFRSGQNVEIVQMNV